MRTEIFKIKFNLHHIGSYLFNAGLLAGFITLSIGITSCGGGGSSGATSNSASTAPTITYLTAIPAASGVTGIVAASSPQTLTIWGANFVSGVAVTVTNSSGTSYTVTSTSVLKTTKITTNVTIPSVPTDSYVTVTVQPPTGSSISGILGVAHAYKTLAADIQPILTNNGCGGCHVGAPTAENGMDLRTATSSANTLINTTNTVCTSTAKLRVHADGDPRRASNALIDVLKAKNSTITVLCQMPSGTASAVPATDIDAIVDWIALGAN